MTRHTPHPPPLRWLPAALALFCALCACAAHAADGSAPSGVDVVNKAATVDSGVIVYPDGGVVRMLDDGSRVPLVYSADLAGAPVILPDGGTAVAKADVGAPSAGVTSVLVPTPTPTQPRTGWLFVVGSAIAFVLRFVVGLLKSPAIGSPWAKMPEWGQWIVLGAATACLTLVDTWLTGASWGTALSEAFTGFLGSYGTQKFASLVSTNKQIVKLTAAGSSTTIPAAASTTTA